MTDLRPLDFGELLDAALVIYRRQFALFLKLAAATLSGPAILLIYLGTRLLGSLWTGTPDLREVGVILVLAIVYYLASVVLTAGTIRIISEAYLGRSPRLGDALTRGLAKLGPLIWVGLAKGAVVGAVALGTGLAAAALLALSGGPVAAAAFGLILLAGVWGIGVVLCGYAVTTPIVVLEDLPSSVAALPRSWELVGRHKLKVLALGVVTFLLVSTLPSAAFRGLGLWLTTVAPALGLVCTALGYLLPLVLAPVIAAVITLMYYDLRVRREAFDLEILARLLDRP